MKAKITFRDGDTYFTAIDSNNIPDLAQTLAQRMVVGGFVICEDDRWGKHRITIVNLGDVKCIVLESEDK